MTDDTRIDFAALAQRAREMTADLAAAKEDLRTLQATGLGGDGLVAATVSGDGTLLKIEIDPAVIDPDDPRRLGELVVLAVQEAQRALIEQRKQRLSRVSGGMDGLTAGLRPRS